VGKKEVPQKKEHTGVINQGPTRSEERKKQVLTVYITKTGVMFRVFRKKPIKKKKKRVKKNEKDAAAKLGVLTGVNLNGTHTIELTSKRQRLDAMVPRPVGDLD